MAGPRVSSHLIFAILFTALAAWCQYAQLAPLQRAELAVADALARSGRTAPVDPALIFLAVDTASANLEAATDLETFFDLREADAPSRRALTLMAHEWPWSREVHALVLDRLIAAGARAVVFDFTFPKPTPNDEPFRLMLEKHARHVVVVSNLSEDHANQDDATRHTLGTPSPSLIPAASQRDPRIGYDNFWPDFDEVVRRAKYRWSNEHAGWASAEEHSLAARALERAGLAASIPAGRSEHRLRFAGPPGTFPPRPIYEIFAPDYWRHNFADGALLRDKIVVIGASGNWQQDIHLTPVGMMPGPELHLNAINAALHKAFIRDLPPVIEALIVAALVGAAWLLRRFIRRASVRFVVQLAATAGWGLLGLLFFDHADVLIPLVGPMVAFNFAGISGLTLDIMVERREKAHLRRTLERYVSRNVVEELVDNPDEFARALGGDLRQVTVLFSDVRGFTRKAHEMNSKELVAQLNEYFSAMVECVFRFGGTLDKFIGDAVMAVWGNARSAGPAGDARNAVACARAMFEELEKLNTRWATEGRPQFRIGIGINSGPVVVGNIGSPQRMEFTVIGDAVNVAWRLQEKTKGDDHLLLGEAVLPLLGDDFPTEIVGEIFPSGDEAVAYARLVPHDALSSSSAPR